MKIIEALKDENTNSFMEVSNGNKWMYFDNSTNEFVVCLKDYGCKTVVHLRTDNEEAAVKELLVD
ncbi:MAG: hypothetical protein ABSG25_01495 [Bryobacteraceae bacterium]